LAWGSSVDQKREWFETQWQDVMPTFAGKYTSKKRMLREKQQEQEKSA
jgi:hypothetical protein